MPDKINTGDYAGESRGPRELHPADTVLMQCVDVVALGHKPETYQGEDKGLTPKLALVFRSTENRTDGTPFDLSQEFTISTGKKAKLRAFLEAWRGAPYTEDYPKVPVDAMCGVWAMVSVVHKPSSDGSKVYANIGSITPVPKALRNAIPELAEYTRADYWATRVAEYASLADAYRAAHATPAPSTPAKAKAAPKPAAPPDNADDFAPIEDMDSDLPF